MHEFKENTLKSGKGGKSLFIVSNDTSCITGQFIHINCGAIING